MRRQANQKTQLFTVTRARPRASLVASAIALLLLGFGAAAGYAKVRKTQPLRYSAYAYASEKRDDCASMVGITAGLHIDLGKHAAIGQLRKKAALNKPTKVVMTVGGHRYVLRPDPSTSGYGAAQISWGFRPVTLTPKVARSLIKRPAVITYHVGKSTLKAKPTVVKDASCS